MTKCLLVMAGGTGGHVFPGIAVADYLKSQGWSIHWLGTSQRMEAQIVPKAGYDISFIDVAGLRGNGIKGWLMAPLTLSKALFQALSVMRKVKPDVVLGMGGFASGPGGIAAFLKGIPLILHEQNAVAGFTNKLLAPLAKKVLTGFDDTFPPSQKVSWVGNPLRSDIQVQQTESSHEGINILVVGGSLGAQALNEAMPQMLNALNQPVSIWHQCGAGREQQVRKTYISDAQVKVSDFIDDMAGAYQWADLIICRAGALTVSEIAMAGKAAIFVPLPYAVDDHQTKNAQALVRCGAARIVKQSHSLAFDLAEQVNQLSVERQQLTRMGQAATSVARPQATKDVADVCKELAKVVAVNE
ncbi:undecaprenyldiphospho-muramoylpentapeptide beta-N-acetylglucosaminyltransferase [Neptunicella marina]|uniref:UDP-N-acetylglucosamine--N-acetylmuramyl-(pentapeptide) pyrophosphoryl-undecaprenol N-acetylglucosamine transferase n=1 Tax=Neptunicella marina TaxID=2125989 RepID=A0A8J6ITT7_9ALTE|nr:undecaprenyldiphospho-muramoylpentapeptide beta-N-acetylglucosaminyltransferase [Neptunicella marina]MBC3765298.1 undecaprenyldiphospho-muramoylpentapeptide beta-N-acetylglucosaminyltransferase [Neptunicella marina]